LRSRRGCRRATRGLVSWAACPTSRWTATTTCRWCTAPPPDATSSTASSTAPPSPNTRNTHSHAFMNCSRCRRRRLCYHYNNCIISSGAYSTCKTHSLTHTHTATHTLAEGFGYYAFCAPHRSRL
jgi:hypothetical protein